MNKRSPADMSAVRRANLSLVARYVHKRGRASRAQVADETELSRSSVTNLVNVLLSNHILRETNDVEETVSGRPRKLLSFDGSHACVAAIQVDSQHIRGWLSTLGHVRLCERTRQPTDLSPSRVASLVVELTNDLREGQDLPLAAAAVSISGPVSGTPPTVLSSDMDWRRPVDFIHHLREAGFPNVPVTLEKNAIAASWAEFHGESDRQSLILLHAGPSLGSGIILNGNIFHAPEGYGVEIGHMQVADKEVITCTCGIPHCLSSAASPQALVKRAGMDSTLPLEEAWPIFEEAVLSGDPKALSALTETAPLIAQAINMTRLIIGKCTVLLGGEWTKIAPVFAPLIVEHTHGVMGVLPEIDTVPAKHGPEAALTGTTLLAIDAALDDPETIPYNSN